MNETKFLTFACGPSERRELFYRLYKHLHLSCEFDEFVYYAEWLIMRSVLSLILYLFLSFTGFFFFVAKEDKQNQRWNQ